ncbi:MAG: S41 family peptidase [Kouleothrix sp.]
MSSNQPNSRPYFRTPTISPDGQQIVFLYAASLWLAPTAGGNAERITAHQSGHSSPRWSPDGQQIAFSSWRAGPLDVYVLSLNGGETRRVTAHRAGSTNEAWSADGEFIYFGSNREQQGYAIYRVAASGGTPVPWLSQPYEQISNLAPAPDGTTLAFSVVRDSWWRRGPNPYGGADLWLVSNAPDATDYRKISDYSGLNRWPMWNATGDGLFFVSDRDGIENIWFQPIGGPAEQITAFREGRLLWPSMSANGTTIVFERDFTIWQLDLASRVAAPIALRVSADTRATPVYVDTFNRANELALAPDGKKIAFVARGGVFADFADKETDKEQRQGVAFRVTNTPFREQAIDWAPHSRALAYTSDRHGDEEIYRYDFITRQETRLTNSDGPKHQPVHSPDGKWLAYTCGDDEIRLIELATNTDTPFIRAPRDYHTEYAWSPDSRWLAFTALDDQHFENVFVQRIGETSAHQITFLSNLNSYGLIWAPNGRFILFTTSQYRNEAQIARVDLQPPAPFFREAEFDRLFEQKEPKAEPKEPAPPATPPPDQPPAEPVVPASTASAAPVAIAEPTEPTEPAPSEPPAEPPAPAPEPAPEPGPAAPSGGIDIAFAGIVRRLRFLTPTQMNAGVESISPDSRDMIFRATVAGKSNLWTQPLDEARREQPPRQLTTSLGAKWAAQFAPDGKSFFYLDNGQVIARKFPTGDQTQLPIAAEVVIDFHQEKRQIFDECWRLLRDRFYDPTFRGLDWRAAHSQFAPLAAGAQTYGDLHLIISLMVGELRASHLGIGGGGGYDEHDGYIGLLFDAAEQARSGRLVVAAVVPDSPAALPVDGRTIAPGDELLAITGTEMTARVNIDTLLHRTAGRRVVLRMARPGSEPYELALRPIPAGPYDQLRYRSWVLTNKAYVDRVSGGRLGYVHIRRMDYDSYQQFLVDLDSENHSKSGVVVDLRFNPGGFISTFILDVLARRSVLLKTFRDRRPLDAGYASGNRVLNKPTILVINEGSHSNAEIMAESYRRLGLGKVVGRPSAGAVIGTYEYQLIDGTNFRLPRQKVATLEGEDLEGQGRKVDIEAELPLGEWARGIDRQLDAAVAALLAQIDSAAGEMSLQ